MKKLSKLVISLVLVLASASNTVFAAAYNDSEVDLYKDELSTVQVFTFSGDEIFINDQDVYLMAQVVYAESRAEPFEGKVAVASVILNRARDPQFPKSIKSVIMQKGAFSCIKNGKINVIPDTNSYLAVIEALKGNDPTDKAVFFYNPKTATSSWMKKVMKNNVKSIGNHTFFAIR